MKAISRFVNRSLTRYPAVSIIVIMILGVAFFGAAGLMAVPFVAMALGKNRQTFSNKGGGLLKIKELTNGGSSTTMDDAGYLSGSGLNIDPKMVEHVDERGFMINAISGGEEWRWKSTLMQVSIDEINLLKTAQNKFFHLYYKSAALPNGNIQEIYIPLVKIVNVLELPFKNDKRSIEVEFLALMPKGAVSVTPSGFNVAADSYGTIVENASALGEVTTQTGTIYTAAV